MKLLFVFGPSQPWQFHSIMSGNHAGGSILNFWKHIKRLSAYQLHEPLHSLSEEELRRTIPFSIHVDGCEFYSDQEFLATSWSSAFSAGGMIKDILVTKFPIVVVAEGFMLEDEELYLNSTLVSLFLFCFHLSSRQIPRLVMLSFFRCNARFERV